jgi:DNA-binding beta-propeller fold protein YncE
MASFINYDYAKEFLVYAHSAPGVKWVLTELEELSERVTGGMDLRFAYDNETSWPNSWYYRHFPNAVFVGANPSPQNLRDAVAVVVGEANRAKTEPLLEDRYFHFEYIRMWWPMQDYFNLSAARVANTFDFSAENTQAAQIRRGLWDIWWARDYSTYNAALNTNYTDTQWPVSDRMHLYVRKDIAAQIWNMGIGEGTVMNPLEEVEVNVCTANWQPLSAQVVFNTAGSPLNHPLDIAVGDDGQVYVAEEFNNRVSIFDSAGNLVGALGAGGAGLGLNRPNGLAFSPEGNLYIADTWNYAIKEVSPSGEVIRAWGQPGQFGFEAAEIPQDGFWGPRDVAVDALGRVYVADTGNKRVRVYTAEGQFIRDIGSGGSGEGQLDEPAGLTIDNENNRLYVADTWNQRVSVFSLEGEPLFQFNVRGWYDDLGNRPYLALDEARDLLYVSDPDAGRVLVYDPEGNCLGSFGQAGSDPLDASQFNVAGGIAVDSLGNVYISDAGANRVLRFAPFPASARVEESEAVEGEVLDESSLDEGEGASGESDILEEVIVEDATEESAPLDENIAEVTEPPMVEEITVEAQG